MQLQTSGGSRQAGRAPAQRTSRRRHSALANLAPVLLSLACGGEDQTELLLPDLGGTLAEPFLGLPASADARAAAPLRLSETRAFAALDSLEPAAGVIPYAVQAPLWSDGARKLRWVALPRDGRVGFSEAGAWRFPEGTVFIKHFGMVLDERAPDVAQRLETRFLVAAEGGRYYGLVYRWDDDQRDAWLSNEGADELLEISTEDGTQREQRYTYPSAGACAACHSSAAGFVLGARTAQLNGDHDYGDGTGPFNQLGAWSSLGIFDQPVGDTASDRRPRLAALGDEAASLEARVRSYWDANCSACHDGSGRIAAWDARFSTPLREQGVLSVAPLSGSGDAALRLIAPGDPEHSLIYLRSSSVDAGARMPPLLRNRVDQRYVELLREWILSLAR